MENMMIDKRNENGTEISVMLKDEERVKEYVNYIVMDGYSKAKSFALTFNLEHPLDRTNQMRLYRWSRTDMVSQWMEKVNKSLEIDWLDKRVNALNRLYDLGSTAEKDKDRVDALDKFLTHLKREEGKLFTGDNNTVNIIQIVSEKLASITKGSVIQPDVIEAEVADGKE